MITKNINRRADLIAALEELGADIASMTAMRPMERIKYLRQFVGGDIDMAYGAERVLFPSGVPQ